MSQLLCNGMLWERSILRSKSLVVLSSQDNRAELLVIGREADCIPSDY